MAMSLFLGALGYGGSPDPSLTGGVEFWPDPERAGWLDKQGEHIKTWRRRWFVLKQSRLFWFKNSHVTPSSVPRGVVPLSACLAVRDADDSLLRHRRGFAFVVSTAEDAAYFVADSEKEKEGSIGATGRSIVVHSGALAEAEAVDYDHTRQQ